MSDIIEVIKDVTTVTIASDGPQGPAGPTGPTGPTGPEGAAGSPGSSGVISVVAPITNTGTSTSAIIGINSGVANGVATLDSNGKVPQSQIPAVAITNTFVVASQAAMLALTAEEGDVAVRTDQNKTYILTATPSSTLANWQELLTPTDTVTSVDGRIGTVTLTDLYAGLATANTFTGGVQQITTASAATKGLIVKGTTSQTANLQEWQDSAGTILQRVTSGGTMTGAGAPDQFGIVSSNSNGTSFRFESTATNGRAWRVGHNFVLGSGEFSIYDQTATAERVRITTSGNTFFPSGTISVNSTSTTLGSGSVIQQFGVVIGTSTFVGAVIRGAASQTGNLQEWQNSAGTVLVSIDSAGSAYIGGSLRVSTTSTYSARLAVNTAAAGNKGLVIQGVASQSGNLQEWQDSAGSVLANISSAGALILWANDGADAHRTIFTANSSGIILNSTRGGGAASNFIIQVDGVERFRVTAGSTALFTNGTAGATAFAIKGAASQTADLLSIQNNSGTVLTAVNASGTINFQTGNTSATANTGAVALPALAVGFITMQVAGTTVKVPYYAN